MQTCCQDKVVLIIMRLQTISPVSHMQAPYFTIADATHASAQIAAKLCIKISAYFSYIIKNLFINTDVIV